MQWISWLLALLLPAGAGYWMYRIDKRRAIPYPWLTALLRALLLFFTLLLLLAPNFTITTNETHKPIVLLLQDDSRSVGIALGKDSAAYHKNVTDLAARLSDKYQVIQWGFGGGVQTDSLFQYRQQATDISGALSRAEEYFGLQNLGAVIVATDGRYNQGANPLFQQLALRCPVYTVGIGDSAQQKDLRIAQAYANKVVSLNSNFEIRADVLATLCSGYNNTLTVTENGNTITGSTLNINTDRYDHAVSFTLKAGQPGLHHYVLSLPPATGEQNTANNRKDVFVEVVDEKKNVLIAAESPHPDVNAIKDALSSLESYKVTVAVGEDIPYEASKFKVLVLVGMPSHRMDLYTRLSGAGKAKWFVLNSQTNIDVLNGEQQLTHLSVQQSTPHDVLPGYNSAFNLFTLPQNIGEVTDKMPPLTTIVGNVDAAPGASVLFSQKGNYGATGAPLWLLQQGRVPSALLLGEGLWRWRLYEYKEYGKHDVVDECIRQTVAFLAANTSEKNFSVSLPKYVWSDQEPITLNATLLNANNEQINTPDVALTITDSAGRKQNYSFERNGAAYTLNIGVWAGGTYTYAAHTTYNGKPYAESGSFVVESMPLELMETGADYHLLYSLAQKYGGAFAPAARLSTVYDSIVHNDRIKPLIQTNTETIPLVDKKWYFFLILLVATAEWLLRKYWLAQ
jgi:hypothetical protein